MKRVGPFLAMAVLTVAAISAHSAEPFSALYDRSTRVQRVEYKENLVVEVAGFVNTPFFIQFSDDEPIEKIARPADAPYEIVKDGSRLFVRPLAVRKEPATLLVMTKTRSYVFDLVAGHPSEFRDRVSKIIFTYPTSRPALVPIAPTAAASQPKAPTPPADGPTLHGYRNDNYSLEVVAETVDIRPREAFDDGRFTYFKFPNNIEIPAIYKSTPGSKEEWLVNSHRDGDYVVMHGVAQLWTFRLAGTVLGIVNDSYEPDGVPPKHGTTVGGLERKVKP